jgi:hypothetical protein
MQKAVLGSLSGGGGWIGDCVALCTGRGYVEEKSLPLVIFRLLAFIAPLSSHKCSIGTRLGNTNHRCGCEVACRIDCGDVLGWRSWMDAANWMGLETNLAKSSSRPISLFVVIR